MSAASGVRLFRGDQPITEISPADRGLAYGDGVFETMRVHDGALPWWPAHAARLCAGAERLGIALPDATWLERQVQALAAESAAAENTSGVLKLLLTRGAGGRGYAVPVAAQPMLLLSRHELPAPAPASGLRLRWCALRLSEQMLLAGIKHCNRLEYVLARAECNGPGAEPGIDDGLLCDGNGRVVCATAGNVFALVAGRWLTPPVARCGVAGLLRQWLLEHVPDVAIAELTPAAVEQADALFIGNAVRGILPVARLDGRDFPITGAVQALRQRLSAAVPMFADATAQEIAAC